MPLLTSLGRHKEERTFLSNFFSFTFWIFVNKKGLISRRLIGLIILLKQHATNLHLEIIKANFI
jgi:hypothetical protein